MAVVDNLHGEPAANISLMPTPRHRDAHGADAMDAANVVRQIHGTLPWRVGRRR